MDRLARGTLVDIPKPLKPPAVVTVEAPKPPPAPPSPAPSTSLSTTAAPSPKQACDLASACPHCGTMMQPEHAHYRCATCGYRDSCCF
jgi:hypothetical protein